MAWLKTIVIGLMDAGYRVITHRSFAHIRAEPMHLSNFGHIMTDYGVDCMRHGKLADVPMCAKMCVTLTENACHYYTNASGCGLPFQTISHLPQAILRKKY